MLKYIIIVIILAVIGFVVLKPLETPQVKELPCDKLVWMRDAPQARCVEYWKQQDLKEQNELLNP